MKHRVFLIAALFVCALAAGALCSSCKVGAVALINLDDNLRMAGSGFDLSGIVTDEDGKLVWECPNCHNRDQSKMNVARRTCGYIGSQFWNQGRTQEIKERVLHLSNHVIDPMAVNE